MIRKNEMMIESEAQKYMDQIQLKIDETGEITLVEDSKIHE